MTLDEIRKMASEERAALPPGETGTVLCFCDATDALLAVVDALPKCACGEPATVVVRHTDTPKCDRHAEVWTVFSPEDLPYAVALRALARRQ